MSYLESFRKALTGQSFLVLDTETTGLYDGEIVQLALIDSDGQTWINTLIKPVKPIPADATAIHGITDEMCKDAPSWPEVADILKSDLHGKRLVVYNAVFDRGMMHKSQERHNLPKIEWKDIASWHCAMEAYAEYWGDYNSYRGNFKWQKLEAAAGRCGVKVENAHQALGDCLMTLGVVKHMLESEAKNG